VSTTLSNALLALLDSKFNPDVYVLPPNTTMTLQMKKTPEYIDDYWLNEGVL